MKHPLYPNFYFWETAVADQISEKLDCDFGDASGILEANPSLIGESWQAGLSPEETANKIINQ